MSKKEPEKYTEDLSFDRKDPNAPAMFVPSISRNYVFYNSAYAKKMTDERAPKRMFRDGREMNFLQENNGCFYYPCGLTSAGHANLDFNHENVLDREGMFRTRDRSKTVVIGDSGGYQIGKGILKFDWKNFESEENNELRLKILRWMESIADISMTLDVPTWGIGGGLEGVDTFEDCLNKTKINHEFFIKHRVPGATRLMNILHGRSQEEADKWWDEMKDMPFEGWALAGVNIADFETILRRIIIMRNEGYLDKKRNWIHFLGVSRLSSACAFTTIQRCIRKYVEPEFTISYDASSPFFSTAKGRMYSRLTYSAKNLSYTMDQAIDNKSIAGSQLPFPLLSPLGKKLVMGDLCVKGNDPTKLTNLLTAHGYPEEEVQNIVKSIVDKDFGKAQTKEVLNVLEQCGVSEDDRGRVAKSINDLLAKSSWDRWSYMFLMNHNTYMHVKGIKEVNQFYDLPRPQVNDYIPEQILKFKDLCEEIFQAKGDKAFQLIKDNAKLLRNLSGSKTDDHRMNVLQTSNVFQLESEDPTVQIGWVDGEHDFDDSAIGNVDDTE